MTDTVTPGATRVDPAPPAILCSGIHLNLDGWPVFADFDLTLAAGEWLALLGPSGVGKTCLLRMIAGLTTPDRGWITDAQGQTLDGRVAYMGQQDLLYPWLTVRDNVTLGARLRGERADRAWATHLLEQVGLAERADALPAALSGGQRQRVALARTLYERRPVVLMDEPFSALDALTRGRVQDLAAELLRGCTVLLITHDPLEACRLGHQVRLLTGSPARLGEPLLPPGAPPRAPDDPAVLQVQGQLLRHFAEADQ